MNNKSLFQVSGWTFRITRSLGTYARNCTTGEEHKLADTSMWNATEIRKAIKEKFNLPTTRKTRPI